MLLPDLCMQGGGWRGGRDHTSVPSARRLEGLCRDGIIIAVDAEYADGKGCGKCEMMIKEMEEHKVMLQRSSVSECWEPTHTRYYVIRARETR